MSEIELRAATPADAERIAAVTAEGFETYRAFAPQGWRPPSAAEELERLRRLLGHEYVWYLVATQASELLGHVGFLPANRLQFAPSDDPGLVHFRQLFVVRAHWGTGLAATLHAAAVQEATARGFTSMRLFTPADQGGPAASTSARAGRSRGRRPSRSASASTSPSTAARYSSSPRRIASATAAARSLTPSFS